MAPYGARKFARPFNPANCIGDNFICGSDGGSTLDQLDTLLQRTMTQDDKMPALASTARSGQKQPFTGASRNVCLQIRKPTFEPIAAAQNDLPLD
jgi:hypothetical protein